MRLNKSICCIVLLLMLIPLVVYGKSCDMDKIKIDSITIKEKTSTVKEIEKPIIAGKKIKVNLKMTQLNDSIEYKMNVRNTSDEDYELDSLSKNTILLKYIVDKNILSFKELVDKFKSIYEFDSLLGNKELFEKLIQNNRLTREDSRYLLNRIDKTYELRNLSHNTSLLKYILNEFVLNKEIVDRFDALVEKSRYRYGTLGIYVIDTIFDLIEYWNKNDEEILKLNELNRKMCSFDLNDDQKLELIEILKNNEIALNRLIQIIDNQLESNFDFESLMNYLKKIEKKNLLNI